jgi:hypothetical protein
LLLSFGASLDIDRDEPYLHYAVHYGADRVVKFFIEEKGMNPRSYSTSVLNVARSSVYRNKVLPYLVAVMRKTKSERQPAPKKLLELTEDNLLKCLSQLSVPDTVRKELHDIVESVYLESHSVTMLYFYETIERQNPELIYASIQLIAQATTSQPKDKTVKNISKDIYVHHGNLEISGSIKIRSLLVTGNLTVKGKASNVQGCQLIVGGDFECDTMYTEGPVVIGGHLKAREVEAYYNDYALVVKQTLQADKLIIDRHQVIAGSFDVTERIEKN